MDEASRSLSPQICTLGNMVARLRSGAADATAFERFMADYGERLSLLECLHVDGQEDAGAAEAMAHHRLWVTQYRNGWRMVSDFVTTRDEVALEQGLKLMVAADSFLCMLQEEMARRHTAWQEQFEARSHVTCPRCGTVTSRGGAQCGRCRFVLPHSGADDSQYDIVVGSSAAGTSVLARLQADLEAWENGGTSTALQSSFEQLRERYLTDARQATFGAEHGEALHPEVHELMVRTAEVLLTLSECMEQGRNQAQAGAHDALLSTLTSIEDQLNLVQELRQEAADLTARLL
ncbi:MAG: hypothetical protein ACYCW6_04400 [Candidatus Xenobia bacterium]